MKTHRKGLKTSNLAYTMLLVQGKISLKYGFLCFLLAVLGSQGIVVKCIATIFFCMVDCHSITGIYQSRFCLTNPNISLYAPWFKHRRRVWAQVVMASWKKKTNDKEARKLIHEGSHLLHINCNIRNISDSTVSRPSKGVGHVALSHSFMYKCRLTNWSKCRCRSTLY